MKLTVLIAVFALINNSSAVSVSKIGDLQDITKDPSSEDVGKTLKEIGDNLPLEEMADEIGKKIKGGKTEDLEGVGEEMKEKGKKMGEGMKEKAEEMGKEMSKDMKAKAGQVGEAMVPEEQMVEVSPYRYIKSESIVKELTVQDAEGNEVKLDIFEATSLIPDRYLKLGKYGFLSDDSGNLVNFKGSVLTPVEEIATFMTKLAKKEDVTKELEDIKGILLVKIFDKGDIMDTIKDLKEMMPTGEETGDEPTTPEKEIDESEVNACQFCGRGLPEERCACRVEDRCACRVEDRCACRVEDRCACRVENTCEPACDDGCCQRRKTCGAWVNTATPKCYTRHVPTPINRPMYYDVEVCEKVPIINRVRIPVHVPVKVPICCPVYVKEYVPNYIKKIVPVYRKIYKEQINVVHVDKPIVQTEIKKVIVVVPIIKKTIIPVIKTHYINKPVPIFETQIVRPILPCACQRVYVPQCQLQACGCQK